MQEVAELRRSLEALEGRLARVEAVQEIHRLKARYAGQGRR